MMRTKKIVAAGLFSSAAFIMSSTAMAGTYTADKSDQAGVATLTNTAAEVSPGVEGALTVSATGGAVTITHAGAADAITLGLNATAAANNKLTLTATGASATVASTGGAGATVDITTAAEASTTTFDINIDSNSIISKAGGAGTAIDFGSTASLANSGTIAAGASADTAIHVTSNTAVIYNSGTIAGTADLAGDAVIETDANTTLNLVNLAGGTIATSGDDAADVAIKVAGNIGTFENYGDIANAAGVDSVAIDLTGDANASLIYLGGGAISGSILLGGTAADTIRVASSSVAINGNIVGNTAVGGNLDVDADFAYNVAGGRTISNTSSIDVASGQTFTLGNNAIDNSENGIDLTLSGYGVTDITDATAAIDAGTNDVIIAANHTLSTDNAAIVAANMISLTGTVSGTLNMQGELGLNEGASMNSGITATGGADRITVNADFTSGGAITGVENFDVAAGTFTTGGTVAGGALSVASNTSFVANHDVTMTGALTLDGILELGAGKTVTATTLNAVSGAGSVVKVNTTSTTNGVLALTAGSGAATDDFSATNFEVVLDTDAQIADGTTRTVVDGAAALTAGTASIDSAILSVTIAATGNDLVVTFDRENAYNTLATNSQTSALGTTLEGLVGSASDELATIITQLDSMSSSAAVAEALETLTPSVDGLSTASLDVQTASLDTVANRLAYMRYGDQGIATGDGSYSEHMWMQAFGSVADQGERKGIAGFESTGYGLAVGFDSSDIFEDALAGVSVAYSAGDVDGKSAADAQTDIDSYLINGYYSRDLQDDMYVDAMLGLAYNSYDTTRNVAVGSYTAQAKGDFDGWQVSGRAAVGRHLAMGHNFQLIPEASAQYTYLSLDKYTETGAGAANLTVDADDNSALVLALGGTAAWDFEHENGSVMRAELRGKYTYDVIGDELTTTSNFVGGGAAFETEGAKVAQHGVVLGAGMKLLDTSGMEFGIDYDATLKADYVNHSGQLKVRWAF